MSYVGAMPLTINTDTNTNNDGLWIATFIVLFIIVNVTGYFAFFGNLYVDIFRDAFLAVYPLFIIFSIVAFFTYYTALSKKLSAAIASHGIIASTLKGGSGSLISPSSGLDQSWPGYIKTGIVALLFFILSNGALYMAFYNCETCPSHELYTILFVSCYAVFLLAMFITFWLFHAALVSQHSTISAQTLEMRTLSMQQQRINPTQNIQLNPEFLKLKSELDRCKEHRKRDVAQKEAALRAEKDALSQSDRDAEAAAAEQQIKGLGWASKASLENDLANFYRVDEVTRYGMTPEQLNLLDQIQGLSAPDFVKLGVYKSDVDLLKAVVRANTPTYDY